jgi:hypothetical protein
VAPMVAKCSEEYFYRELSTFTKMEKDILCKNANTLQQLFIDYASQHKMVGKTNGKWGGNGIINGN